MKNTSKWFRIFALVAVIGFSVSCGDKGSGDPTGPGGGDPPVDPPKVIAAEWRETLPYSDNYSPSFGVSYTGFTTVIGENTITLSGGTLGSDVTITGIYTEGGGPVTLLNPGAYTYVYKDGAKIGCIVGYLNFTAYMLQIGNTAKGNASDWESTFGITLDLSGVPDYPSIQGL